MCNEIANNGKKIFNKTLQIINYKYLIKQYITFSLFLSNLLYTLIFYHLSPQVKCINIKETVLKIS